MILSISCNSFQIVSMFLLMSSSDLSLLKLYFSFRDFDLKCLDYFIDFVINSAVFVFLSRR